MINDQAELGLLVKLSREHLGLTQGELARRLEVSRTAIAHLEQGLRLPEPRTLRRICEFLQLSPVLFEGFAVTEKSHRVSVRCHCLTYYTKWSRSSAEDKRRDRLVYAVKNDQPWRDGGRRVDDPYRGCAQRLRKKFSRLFPNRRFVPVPRSLASKGLKDAAWPSLRLAQACAASSAESSVQRLFHRRTAIRRSSDPDPSEPRPTVAEHLDTLSLELPGEEVSPGIVLVDDVATRGSTLSACAALLVDAGWRGRLDALVIAYVRGPGEEEPKDGHELSFVWEEGWDYPRREAQ